MRSRTIIIRALAGIGGVIAIALVYIALQAKASLDRIFPAEEETALDTSLVEPEREEISDQFATLFQSSYSIDTVHGDAEHFIIDTMYQALPREERVGGRKVSISICGVDSRLNERVEHADANHVVTLWLDSGSVDIVSIPRDTPCDAGFPRSSRLNNLSNLRARKGRDAYLREVATIAGLDTVEYYVELGFSQARGVLELLGYGESAGSTLRILRSRQIFSAGDFQRSYNQGEFIRQMLLRQFSKLDGVAGAMLLRAGLYLVTTNLTADLVDSLHTELRSKGFPGDGHTATVSIRPAYYAKMAVFNFSDSLTLGNLLSKIDRKASALGIGQASRDSAMLRFRGDLDALIARAAADSAKLPVRVIAHLRRCFAQRIWWQLPDRTERERYRSAIGALLANAYTRTGKPEEAARVREVVEFERYER